MNKTVELDETLEKLNDCCEGDFTIIGDNLDLLVHTVGTTESKRNRFYHWFHIMGKSIHDFLIFIHTDL